MTVWKCQRCGWKQNYELPLPSFEYWFDGECSGYVCPECGCELDFDANALPYGDEDE